MNRNEKLISELITPVAGSATSLGIVIGAPVLPGKFVWRGAEYAVSEVLETWKESGPCTHGSGEIYVRKHWFRIRTATGEEMKIYFERKARSGKQQKQRWWVYTVC